MAVAIATGVIVYSKSRRFIKLSTYIFEKPHLQLIIKVQIRETDFRERHGSLSLLFFRTVYIQTGSLKKMIPFTPQRGYP